MKQRISLTINGEHAELAPERECHQSADARHRKTAASLVESDVALREQLFARGGDARKASVDFRFLGRRGDRSASTR